MVGNGSGLLCLRHHRLGCGMKLQKPVIFQFTQSLIRPIFWGQEYADYLIVLISFVFYHCSSSILFRIPRVALALLLGHLYSLYLRQSFTCPLNVPFWFSFKLIICQVFASRSKWMPFSILNACANYSYLKMLPLVQTTQISTFIFFYFAQNKHVYTLLFCKSELIWNRRRVPTKYNVYCNQ